MAKSLGKNTATGCFCRFRHRHGVAAIAVMCWTATAFAQTPMRGFIEESGGVIDWAVAVAIAAVVCGAGFWNPKRSHQN